MRVISFKLEEELLQELDLYVINSRSTRSDVIREAIKLYLSMKKSSCKGRVYRKNSIGENFKNSIRVQEL